MTDRSKLLALAEAVEKLTGPDVEIDSKIWRVVFGRQDGEDPALDPTYTASLDAAMTLVPEDWSWTMGRTVGFKAAADLWISGKVPSIRCLSATPALALCAAALRAQAEALA